MAYFSGTIISKLDKKKRVSVPASFRQVLSAENATSFFLRPSFVHDALEGFGPLAMRDVADRIAKFDPATDEADAFSTAYFADSVELAWDSDNRIVLPDQLCAHAKLEDEALFAGMGPQFRLWAPAAFYAFREKARALAFEKRGLLDRRGPDGAGP